MQNLFGSFTCSYFLLGQDFMIFMTNFMLFVDLLILTCYLANSLESTCSIWCSL